MHCHKSFCGKNKLNAPRPHIWLPHAVDIPLCLPGKCPWVGNGKRRCGKIRGSPRKRERDRNVKVESAQLCVKWWPLLEFPSFWNSTSTYFCSAALAWHMSSSLAIPVSQVWENSMVPYSFLLSYFWLHYYHQNHPADLKGSKEWAWDIAYTPHCSPLTAAIPT